MAFHRNGWRSAMVDIRGSLISGVSWWGTAEFARDRGVRGAEYSEMGRGMPVLDPLLIFVVLWFQVELDGVPLNLPEIEGFVRLNIASWGRGVGWYAIPGSATDIRGSLISGGAWWGTAESARDRGVCEAEYSELGRGMPVLDPLLIFMVLWFQMELDGVPLNLPEIEGCVVLNIARWGGGCQSWIRFWYSWLSDFRWSLMGYRWICQRSRGLWC